MTNLKWFIAAAEQATRYGRQIGDIERQLTHLHVGIEHPLSKAHRQLVSAWQTFIAQFPSNSPREVLTRTFWEAYYS